MIRNKNVTLVQNVIFLSKSQRFLNILNQSNVFVSYQESTTCMVTGPFFKLFKIVPILKKKAI